MRASHDRLHQLRSQIDRLHIKVERIIAKHRRISWLRLYIFLASIAVGIALGHIAPWLGWTATSMLLAVFVCVAYTHQRMTGSIRKFHAWIDIKQMHAARLTLDWNDIPQIQDVQPAEGHPFAFDLDIIGKHSLLRLINAAVSREGVGLLAQWLLHPNLDVGHIRERQELIRELIPMSRFRDKLTLHFKLVARRQLEGDALLRWLAKSGKEPLPGWALPVSMVLAIVNVLLFGMFAFELLPAYWILSSGLYAAVYFVHMEKLNRAFEDAAHLDQELQAFRALIRFLESYPYGSKKRLAALCEPFTLSAERPSVMLSRVSRLFAAMSMRANPVIGLLLNSVFPWDIAITQRLENCKNALMDRLPIWLGAWNELEAAISLANFAWLNPDYTFPEIHDAQRENSSLLNFRQAGHPLLPRSKKVCNDFAMDTRGQIALVTGSNMSGKSTFLRTIGVNVVLAYAGAPVNAEQCDLRLLRLFTCIRVTDSVTDGFSYFYAEVRRLKELLNELARPDTAPVLFLIDEIFKGTNNRERLIGSRSYIRSLASAHSIGLITTHDLELTDLANQAPMMRNCHFRETVVDGKLSFEYQLHEGPCPTTNALVIMQLEGLPVEGQ